MLYRRQAKTQQSFALLGVLRLSSRDLTKPFGAVAICLMSKNAQNGGLGEGLPDQVLVPLVQLILSAFS
jgi:hypothetical protein